MNLVIFLSDEKESLGQISALLNRFEYEKAIIVKDKKTEKQFNDDKIVFVEVDCASDLFSLKSEMQQKLKRELASEFEVALSIAAGKGKEHMALISALLAIPVGVKFIVYTKNGVEFVN